VPADKLMDVGFLRFVGSLSVLKRKHQIAKLFRPWL